MHILSDRPLFSQLLFLSPQLSVFSPKIPIRKALPSWFLSFSSFLTALPAALEISHHFRPTTLLFHVQPKVSIPTTVMARWWCPWPCVPCSLAPPKTSPPLQKQADSSSQVWEKTHGPRGVYNNINRKVSKNYQNSKFIKRESNNKKIVVLKPMLLSSAKEEVWINRKEISIPMLLENFFKKNVALKSMLVMLTL